MNGFLAAELNDGLMNAFVDREHSAIATFCPSFVSNDWRDGKKVLSSIEEELLTCDSFRISVAFVTLSGIEPLLQTLKELEKKGIPGQILTTNYLSFSDPKAIKKLHELSNIEVRMYDTEAAGNGFHTKGYIFRKEEILRIIIGSSNLTSSALTKNREWNIRIVSSDQGQVTTDILNEYQELWNSPYTSSYDDFIDSYSERYRIAKHQREIAAAEQTVSLQNYRLQPNSMQTGFISGLRDILNRGEDRALLISATGTGKTYASAFAMRELGFKRVLFVVHRGELAKQTRASYKRIFGSTRTMGLVGAGAEDYDCDYIFATVQTLSRETHLFQFSPDHFDAIVFDESHHSAASTYQKIMSYFHPRLWLGMTATPDRRDAENAGKNIYEIFHYQIAYEIRLQQAMEEDLLCPFHYFGITDIENIGDTGDESQKLSEEDFNRLTSDERVRHILQQSEYYGYSGDRVRGLVFCSRIKEAEELARKFRERGYRAIALDSKSKDREKAFERLAMKEENAEDTCQPLDYIFSVDILNEGVDIVEVNQVIMLRPTESPIVFIQQLGRGLRKAAGKEFVVVLDFIGNYQKNFLIPVALSGDRTYNKDNIRRYVLEGDRVIPGASTVHFDAVARKRIFESVDAANFSDIHLIRDSYQKLKDKLGHIPSLMDFDRYGEMDVLHIFENKSLGSYYNFLVKYEPEYSVRLTPQEAEVIEFVSCKLASGKRVSELVLLSRAMHYREGLIRLWRDSMKTEYRLEPSQANETNTINVLTNEFPSGSGRNTYKDCVLIEKDGKGDYQPTEKFIEMLKNPNFANVLNELLQFGIHRYESLYKNRYQDTDLVLYQKYTYEDVCRLLNWKQNVVPLNIGGYKFDEETRTFPVFINYDKTDDIADSTKYEDHFVSNRRLIAISKNGRTLESADVQNFLKSRERKIAVELFVRKNKDDAISKEFYYLGRMTATGQTKEFTMPNTDKSAVEIEWELQTPVREDLYEYLVNG